MKLLNRLKDLIVKLISVKGVVFIMATVLLGLSMIPWYVWALSGLALISLRTLEKFIAGFATRPYWRNAIEVEKNDMPRIPDGYGANPGKKNTEV